MKCWGGVERTSVVRRFHRVIFYAFPLSPRGVRCYYFHLVKAECRFVGRTRKTETNEKFERGGAPFPPPIGSHIEKCAFLLCARVCVRTSRYDAPVTHAVTRFAKRRQSIVFGTETNVIANRFAGRKSAPVSCGNVAGQDEPEQSSTYSPENLDS